MSTPWPDFLPLRVLRVIEHQLHTVREFNTEVLRYRSLDQQLGANGRYEYEYRSSAHVRVQLATHRLDDLAVVMRRQGHDPETLFAALGGRPALEPLSPEAAAWTHPGRTGGPPV
jgi:hypothetical protein